MPDVMKLTSKQMALLLGITHRGFTKFVRNMSIPHSKVMNRFMFDLTDPDFPDFFFSIAYIAREPENKLQAVYSLRDLARLTGKNKKTVRQLLTEHDIKMYRNGRKLVVLLIDFLRLQARIAVNVAKAEKTRTTRPKRQYCSGV